MKTSTMPWRAPLGAAVLVTLAACGQKGPLYLPEKGGEVVTRPAAGQAQPSPEAAPQPATQAPPDETGKPEEQKKSETPR